MSILRRLIRRRPERVYFCDRCSQVTTARACSREYIESARVRAMYGARLGR